MSDEQINALRIAFPYILALVGGPAGFWAIVKAGIAFREWLRDTRKLAEAGPALAQTADLVRQKDREAIDRALDKTSKDIDGLGRKVGDMYNQAGLDRRDCAALQKAHEKLEAEFRADQKDLPDKLTKARHDVADGPLGQLAQSLDERLDELKEDHGRRLDRIEDRINQGGKSA